MKEKIKVIIAVIICIVILLLGLFLGRMIFGQKAEETGIEETTVVTLDILEKIIMPASDLVTAEYRYKNASFYEKDQKINGWSIPLTTDKTVFTYRGTISAGIDLNDVEFEIDDLHKTIKIHLPEVKVTSHVIDENSFVYLDVKDSIFTQTNMEDYTGAIADLKKNTEEELLADGELYQDALQNAKEVINGFLKNAEVTGDYEIIFEQ